MRDHRVSKSTLNKYDTCEILPLTSIGKIWLPMQVKCLYQDPKQVKTLHSISLQNQTPKHVISNAKSIPLFSFCVFLTLYSRYVCIVPDLENDILFTCFLGRPWYPLVNDHCPPPPPGFRAFGIQWTGLAVNMEYYFYTIFEGKISQFVWPLTSICELLCSVDRVI